MSTHKTACILCSENCGLEVTVDDHGKLTRIVGDSEHPLSEGYLCQKAARLDHYQNHADRLDTPLRRREDGSFEPISWDVAIREIADELVRLRDQHGGRSLAYYGGGGQGNHLGGVYSSALRGAMKTRFLYTALAQEKTGDFWVNGKLFGRQTCHVTDDLHHSDCALFIGTNPWQAHGIPQARRVLKQIANDPARKMIVVDPRRTETAELADLHLAIRPSTDAFLIAAMLRVMLDEGLFDRAFIEAHTTGIAEVEAILSRVSVADYASRCGVPVEDIERAARMFASAERACVRVDLGIQQSRNSTLNSYLEKLLFLLTGNFAKAGGNNLHTFLLPLIGHSDETSERAWKTTVTGTNEIGRLFPPNVLPKEIDSDHEGRIRGLVVDSANPVMSGADHHAYCAAFDKLELLVVIDVALTETAQRAHYVLPASSQLEKWESTFFTVNFPVNGFHLRAPFIRPKEGTLTEPEIYRRLVTAMGAMPARMPVLEWIARIDRRVKPLRLFPMAFAATMRWNKPLRDVAALVLYETLGKTLPEGAKAAAVLWGAAQQYAQKHPEAVRRAGHRGRGAKLGEALFDAMLNGRSGMKLSEHLYDDVWSMVRTEDRRVHLAIPSLLDSLDALRDANSLAHDTRHPLVLVAGERRSYNANTIFRDPAWRRKDPDGALHIHPEDASALGLSTGSRARCASKRGAIDVVVEVTDRVQRGMVTLPHGYGLDYPDESAGGARKRSGPVLNVLTSSDECDPIAKTPYHKYVPVRLEPLA